MRISKGHYAPQAEDPDPVPAHVRLSEPERKALAKRAFELMDRKKAERASLVEELKGTYPQLTDEEIREAARDLHG